LRNPAIFTQLVNFCWSLFKWTIALALVAAIALGAYLYLRLDDEIRRSVERRIAQHYAGLHVHVGRARFEPDRGISIFDITIGEQQISDDGQPVLAIGELCLSGRVRMDQLVTEDLAVEEIVVRRATLRAVRQESGSWNIGALMPLPNCGECSPVIRIEDATLCLVDGARPAATFTLQGIELTLTPTQAAGTVASPGKRFRIEGSAAGVPARELRCIGELGTSDGTLNVTVTIAGLEVSTDMLAAIPRLSGEATAGVEMSGRADAQIQISRASAAEPIQWSADINVDRGRIKHLMLPEPLTEVRIVGHATAERLKIQRLDAKCGSAAVALAAERVGWSSHGTLGLAARVTGLQLNESLPERMPESIARIWKRFNPLGIVDADLRLQFDGKEWRPQLTATCRGITLTDAEKFPYVVQRTTGKLVYTPTSTNAPDQLTLDLTGFGGGRPIKIEADLKQLAPRKPTGVTTDTDLASEGPEGEAGWRVAGYRGRPTIRKQSRPHPVGWVKVSGTDIPLHEQLLAAIPAEGQKVVRSLRAQGAVDFTFLAEWKDQLQPRATVTQQIRLKDCSIRYQPFPYPLRGVNGLVVAEGSHWKLQNIRGIGADDSTVVECSGEVIPRGSGGFHTKLSFVATNIPLDDNLRQALTPGGQQAWDELRPQGRIDFNVAVLHDTNLPKPQVEVSLKPCDRSVSLQLSKFEYRLEEVEGEATYKTGRVDFRKVSAHHDREVFSAESGTWQVTPDGGWQVALNGCNIDRITPHRELLGALPPRLQMAIERLQPEGTFGVYNSGLSFAKIGNSDRMLAAWDVNLDCHQAVFRGGLPLQNITGGVRLFGRDGPELSYCAGELNIDSVIWKDVQLTNVRGPLWIDNTTLLLGEQATAKLGQPTRRITADAYGGSLAANVQVRHDNGPTYQLDLALGAADLSRFANERLGSPPDMNGTVSGRLAISGSGSSLQSLNGTGEMHVVDANIYRLPLLVSMLKVPNLRNRTPDTTAFNRCDMKFKVQGEHMYFEQLNLLGDAVSLYGKGESGFDRRLDLVFYTLLEPAMPIPLWKTVAGQVSQQTLQLNVVGTWDNPKVQPETLPGVSQVLEQIQTEFQGATSTSASAATRRESAPR